MAKRRESSLASDQDRDLWFVPGLPTTSMSPMLGIEMVIFFLPTQSLSAKMEVSPSSSTSGLLTPHPFPISPALMSQNYDSFSENTTLLALLTVLWRLSSCWVAKLCLTLCNHMDYSTPGFPALHYLLEFTQTHVYWVGDAIQPSHPLLPPSPPALNLSHHQGLTLSQKTLLFQHSYHCPVMTLQQPLLILCLAVKALCQSATKFPPTTFCFSSTQWPTSELHADHIEPSRLLPASLNQSHANSSQSYYFSHIPPLLEALLDIPAVPPPTYILNQLLGNKCSLILIQSLPGSIMDGASRRDSARNRTQRTSQSHSCLRCGHRAKELGTFHSCDFSLL